MHHILTFTLRILKRNKLFSSLNILGLALGMAGGIVVFQLVKYHLSVDTYHKNAERTYRVVVDLHLDDNNIEKEKGSSYILHETLKKDFSSVENSTYLAHKKLTIAIPKANNAVADKYLEKDAVSFTDANYFKVFDYEWKVGIPQSLNVPNNVVLTESYAKKYFGEVNPLGKIIRADNTQDLVVVGILKDLPANTDFKTNVFVSLPTLKILMPEYGYEDWGWIDSNRETFITLRSGDLKEVFEKQMPAFSNKYHGPDGKIFHYHLQELSDVHFNIGYGGKIKQSTITLLSVIGVLMVVIACINFINLSTAQSFKRYKEIGVRKTLGSSQSQVFWQFITETSILTVFSTLFALFIAYAVTPLVSQWLKTPINIDLLTDFQLSGFIIALVVLIIVIAGFYPSMIISNFNPLKALKSITYQDSSKGISIRKGLVVSQFSISFVLIAVSILVVLQLNYLKKKDLGMDKELILHVNVPGTETNTLTTFKNQLLQQANVQGVSFFRNAPSDQLGSGGSIKYDNRDWEKFVARSKIADENYIHTYGLKLISGRQPIASDTLRELLVNQKLVKALGLQSPDEILNKRLLVGDLGKTGTIVGVVSDFNNTDLYSGVEPTVIYSSRTHYRQAAIKLKSFHASSTIQTITQIWEKLYPDDVFEYSFFEDQLVQFYEREELISNLTKTFAIVSIFISCLGLFGLATFSIKQRTKEIGIRKVLGASVVSITTLLSKDFLKLVVIAIVIASPIAYYFMNQWLQDFAYRVNIEWWLFASAAIVAVLIAVLTIGYQAIKAALMNPVKTLKSE